MHGERRKKKCFRGCPELLPRLFDKPVEMHNVTEKDKLR
jgi:hypothetical protein